MIEMDTTIIALIVAIVVILILLMSCWKKPEKRRKSRNAAPVQQPQYRDCDTVEGMHSGKMNTLMEEQYSELSKVAGYDDYNSMIQAMALEPEVYQSHSQYAKDMGASTSTSSMWSVRDDPNDVNPWVGLRKPKYRSVWAGESARQTTSETPDEMREDSYYVVG